MDGASVTETRLNKTDCQRDAITIQKKSIPDAPSAQISQAHFSGAVLSCQARKIQKHPVLITRKCASSTHFGNGSLNAYIARRFGAPSGRQFCRCHTSITLTFTIPFVTAKETLLSQQLDGAIQCLFVSQNGRFRPSLQKKSWPPFFTRDKTKKTYSHTHTVEINPANMIGQRTIIIKQESIVNRQQTIVNYWLCLRCFIALKARAKHCSI